MREGTYIYLWPTHVDYVAQTNIILYYPNKIERYLCRLKKKEFGITENKLKFYVKEKSKVIGSTQKKKKKKPQFSPFPLPLSFRLLLLHLGKMGAYMTSWHQERGGLRSTCLLLPSLAAGLVLPNLLSLTGTHTWSLSSQTLPSDLKKYYIRRFFPS